MAISLGLKQFFISGFLGLTPQAKYLSPLRGSALPSLGDASVRDDNVGRPANSKSEIRNPKFLLGWRTAFLIPNSSFLIHPTDVRIVTNSSAAVGWMPMVESKVALVAPALRATAMP